MLVRPTRTVFRRGRLSETLLGRTIPKRQTEMSKRRGPFAKDTWAESVRRVMMAGVSEQLAKEIVARRIAIAEKQEAQTRNVPSQQRFSQVKNPSVRPGSGEARNQKPTPS